MRDDLPPGGGQDLHPVPSDGLAPTRWVRSVNRACTAWLLARGLLDEMLEELQLLRQDADEGQPEEVDSAPKPEPADAANDSLPETGENAATGENE